MKPAIINEPYRIFFPLAVLSGLLGVGHWLFYGLGWVEHYSGFLHASIQMQVCMGCFIAGFLMTAMPRMSATETATRFEVSLQLTLTLLMLFAYLFNAAKLGLVAYAVWLLALARFFMVRFRKRDTTKAPLATPPVEFVWIPAGLVLSLIAVLCIVFGKSAPRLAYFGQQMVNQAFVLAAVAGVGSFMGARLTGRVRMQKKPEALCKPEEGKVRRVPRKNLLLQIICILIFTASFVIEGFRAEELAYGLRAASLTVCFLASGVLPKWPKVSDLFAWVLWISFWMTALGLWGVTFHAEYRKASMHVSFVGGLGLMTYAVATMVILSHAGKSDMLRRPLLIFWFLLAGVLSSLAIRIAAVFDAENYFHLLSQSSSLWIATGAIWLLYIARYVFMTTTGEKIEKQHEALKKRVLRDDKS